MTSPLGRDFAASMAARFGGRLYAATLTKHTPATYDGSGNRVAGATAPYTCSAIAFSYSNRFVDGEQVRKGDYRVVIIRGTLTPLVSGDTVLPNPGDTIAIPTPGRTTPQTGTIVNIEGVSEAQITVQVRGPTP